MHRLACCSADIASYLATTPIGRHLFLNDYVIKCNMALVRLGPADITIRESLPTCLLARLSLSIAACGQSHPLGKHFCCCLCVSLHCINILLWQGALAIQYNWTVLKPMKAPSEWMKAKLAMNALQEYLDRLLAIE
jgi:hypothetical protein